MVVFFVIPSIDECISSCCSIHIVKSLFHSWNCCYNDVQFSSTRHCSLILPKKFEVWQSKNLSTNYSKSNFDAIFFIFGCGFVFYYWFNVHGGNLSEGDAILFLLSAQGRIVLYKSPPNLEKQRALNSRFFPVIFIPVTAAFKFFFLMWLISKKNIDSHAKFVIVNVP